MTIETRATHIMIPGLMNILLTRLFQLEAQVSVLLQQQVFMQHCQCVKQQQSHQLHVPSQPSTETDTPAHNEMCPPQNVTERNISGTVKWFNVLKGFGFITRTDTKEDVFVHKTNISKSNSAHKKVSLGQCEQVLFDVVRVSGRSSPEAINVTGPDNTNVIGRKRNFVDESSATPTACIKPAVADSHARTLSSTHLPKPAATVNQDPKPVTWRLPKLHVPKKSHSSRQELFPRYMPELVSHRPEPTPPTEPETNSILASAQNYLKLQLQSMDMMIMCSDTTD